MEPGGHLRREPVLLKGPVIDVRRRVRTATLRGLASVLGGAGGGPGRPGHCDPRRPRAGVRPAAEHPGQPRSTVQRTGMRRRPVRRVTVAERVGTKASASSGARVRVRRLLDRLEERISRFGMEHMIRQSIFNDYVDPIDVADGESALCC